MFLRLAAALAGITTASLLSVTPAAAATTPVPTSATTLTAPTAMAAANGRLFVSDGNSVVVLGTDGVTVKTLTGMFGARDIVVSAAGDRAFVALSQAGAIAVLDTAGLTEVARWTTSPCPAHLAFAGARLFYGFGCDGGGGTGLGSVDAASGADPQTVAGTDFYKAPLLAGGGDILAVAVPGLSPAKVRTYRVEGSAVTPLGSAEVGSNLGGIAVSRDGARVATAAGAPYHLSQFTAATMAPAGTFDTGPYPVSVAYSHDGTRLGGGVSAHGAGNVTAFDLSTGGSVLSGNAHPKPAYNQPEPVKGTLTWSGDDSRLYTLLEENDNGNRRYWLAAGFGTVPVPAATTTRLTLTAPAKFGDKVRATATVAGRPGAPVRFVRTGPGATVTVTARTNAGGTATVLLAAPSGGKVTAYYDGNDTSAPSSASAVFKTLTRTAIILSGQYRTVQKVAYFRKKSDVLAKVTLAAPVAGRKVTLRLQRKNGTAWPTVQTKTFTLPNSGVDYFTLVEASKGVQFRFAVAFAGDAYGKPSSATSGALVVK
ncbi:hypothetical protein [Actinoplanes utahensis]|uniref:Ig-like domain repeat protein n=1 Tax=Actinoplanes utahensis TaxID=1869 RepID=A0A0A6ULC7_ACTUT|nr:hypothetical protein [Actinoplanes utahensis]KHD75853.1 hypothetical protein MB27_20720 [Actinoplanes utahensis]GIF32267.1 hypothetical protein Aut01nite_52530 [Actinoplanes utahensis]